MNRAELEHLARELTQLTTPEVSHPNLLPTAIALRDISHLRSNSKLFATYVAKLEQPAIGSNPLSIVGPEKLQTRGRVCKQDDFSSSWFIFWTKEIMAQPILHRKLWETAYVAQCLLDRDCLQGGKKGLGFAVGREALPSLFAKYGAEVVATDLSPGDPRSQVWNATNQHSDRLEFLWKGAIIAREKFEEKCKFEFVDMNDIPARYDGQFDFCWSVCAFEHLGSINSGLNFVRKAMRTLKPGGIAVHTTEYNLLDEETIDNWGTVLYQKKHFAELSKSLAAENCRLEDIDFNPGSGFFDSYVDVPPYPHDVNQGIEVAQPPHIKLSIDGFPATSIAIIAERLR
jgi:SAM-dependent methyltransferase